MHVTDTPQLAREECMSEIDLRGTLARNVVIDGLPV